MLTLTKSDLEDMCRRDKQNNGPAPAGLTTCAVFRCSVCSDQNFLVFYASGGELHFMCKNCKLKALIIKI